MTRFAFCVVLAACLAACAPPVVRGPNPLADSRSSGFSVTKVEIANPDAYPEVSPALKEAIERVAVPALSGQRPIRISVVIDHYQAADGGSAFLIGSADVLAATAMLIDDGASKRLAEYPINQARPVAGLLGLAIRGDDAAARTKLVNGFAEKLVLEINR
jgi:hypothetical protein